MDGATLNGQAFSFALKRQLFFNKTNDMARIKNNVLMEGLSGTVAGLMVYKHYASGTVVSKIPDMSGVKPTAKQKKEKKVFAQAVAYAKGILNDSVKKKALAKKLKTGERVYNAAIREFYSKRNVQ
jgi:hypothetical protein